MKYGDLLFNGPEPYIDLIAALGVDRSYFQSYFSHVYYSHLPEPRFFVDDYEPTFEIVPENSSRYCFDDDVRLLYVEDRIEQVSSRVEQILLAYRFSEYGVKVIQESRVLKAVWVGCLHLVQSHIEDTVTEYIAGLMFEDREPDGVVGSIEHHVRECLQDMREKLNDEEYLIQLAVSLPDFS